MKTINYRQLAIDECDRIKEIDASQFIRRAWREADGIRQLVEINYQEHDFPDGFEKHLLSLKETIASGGIALGALDNGTLVGFCSINNGMFGKKYKYVLLDQLFVSKEYRGKGIGKELFLLSANEAKKWGAEKFYICAGSAEETIAFYSAVGCEDVKEINKNLHENDTRDWQLEYDFAFL